MDERLHRLLDEQGGVVTAGQALTFLRRRELEAAVKRGALHKVWYGIYGRGQMTVGLQLRGLDLAAGTTVAACLGTAAAAYGFDTEQPAQLHVVNPGGAQLRPVPGLVVHRREGAPLRMVAGRPATAPAWTAIEVARGLRRPRALATLDAALRSGTCTRQELNWAVNQQAGRRGIVAVRELLPLANPLAESPMESEARLVMIDGGVPPTALQYRIMDATSRVWRVDFAWPEHRLAVEYDGLDWHSGPQALVYDRMRRAALQEVGWEVLAIIFDDVRRRPQDMVRRIDAQLVRRAA
ncbi:endonuclease domain-containing protein [Mycobacterium sp. pUA109]|uniref:endonuclease domain-containing protein n=1 Tax=Mycobacterium sp. pUA109 TaxID=3238982 RepID=UPI00351BD59A